MGNTLYSSELSELESLRLFFLNALYSTPTLFQSSPERAERLFLLNALYLFTALFQSSTASSSPSLSSSRFLFLYSSELSELESRRLFFLIFCFIFFIFFFFFFFSISISI